MRRSFLLLPNGKPSKSLGNRIKYVKEVFASLPDAWKSIYGDGTVITRHMEKNGFLIAAEEGYRSEAGMGRSRLTLDEDSFALKFVKNQTEEICKLAVKNNPRTVKYINITSLSNIHKLSKYYPYFE